MSERREWDENYAWAASRTELSKHHNATVRAYRDAMTEIERLGKANDEACDRIAQQQGDIEKFMFREKETLDENNLLDRELNEARQAIKALESRPALTWEECEAKVSELGVRGVMLCSWQYEQFRSWLKSRLPAPVSVSESSAIDRIADAAEKYIARCDESKPLADAVHEATLAHLQSIAMPAPTDSIRVPFSAAQIEAMARAAEDCYEIDPDATFESAIRAALAAGGLEPCAVPEYDPADVALRPERASDEELGEVLRRELGMEGLPRPVRAAAAVRARVEAPLLAEIAEMKIHCDGRDAQVKHLECVAGKLHTDVSGLEDMVQRGNERWARVVAERDTLKARVAELEAEAEANIEWQETMVLDLKRKDAELEAAKAERDQWKRKNHCYFVEVEELKKELAALRQPVDPDAWMTPLEIDHKPGYPFHIESMDGAFVWCEAGGIAKGANLSPTDAARAAQWLASYAAAHGCPVSLGQPIHPPLDATRPKAEQGIYDKYRVCRTDRSDAPGCKHDGCQYFVLDRTHDKFAAPALTAYGLACATEYPELSRELLSAYPAPETRKAKVNGYDFTAHDLDTWMQKELNWSTTPEKAVKLMNYMAAHAHAVIDVPQGVPSVEELAYLAWKAENDKGVAEGRDWDDCEYDDEARGFAEAGAAAIRDAVLGSLPRPTPHEPTDAEVEALALSSTPVVHVCSHCGTQRPDGTPCEWSECPRAFAHIGKPSRSNAEMQVCINRKNRRIDALKACVRKWKAKTNEPATGWELDVTAGELWDAYDKAGGGNSGSWQAVVDLCRSRIRPTFGPCQECAKHVRRAYDDMARYAAARAALEGE
jgi:hypothetical protein